jgi:hypothetical protein
MKFAWIAAALALSLLSCAPPAHEAATDPQAPAGGCDKTAYSTIAFTAPDALDIVETRSIGKDCANAVVMITIRKASGEPLWAWATTHGWLGNGAGAEPGAMDAFLQSWKPKVDTTAALPDWPDRDVFKESLGAFMHTPFDRDQYLEIRGKGYPRLCHATGIESGLCVYYDPSTGAVFKVFESGA